MEFSRSKGFESSALVERNIIRNVYLWMTLGLAVTGVIAGGIASSPSLLRFFFSNSFFFIGIIIAEFALVMFLSARISSMSATAATLGFTAYAMLNGITMSLVFVVYAGESIALAFFVSAATFGAMSIYAVSTKRDLSNWGHYLFMGLIGLIIASVINIFLKSSGFDYLISYAGVLLFMGLTAYDTQYIKKLSDRLSGNVLEGDYIKFSIMGALKLYLDFINIFLFFLRILGRRR